MLQWKHDSNGESALLIKGARRVGKSTLAQQFAQNEYDSHIAIDFARCKKEVRNLLMTYPISITFSCGYRYCSRQTLSAGSLSSYSTRYRSVPMRDRQ